MKQVMNYNKDNGLLNIDHCTEFKLKSVCQFFQCP